ncbi:hypothetical protein [Limimaricola soesokkakensis]|uniref:hypothetical protein n=1 Tax=Limimaricola soesokkakensis TaxID=1343159 RepID=UPI0035129EE5
MCERSCDREAVVASIHQALDAGDKVFQAYAEAEKINALSKEQCGRLQEVLSGIHSGTIFTPGDLQEIRALAKGLEEGISKGTTTWHVHDENDMSGGHQESVLSDAAEALNGLRSGLCNLAGRISEVLNRSRAERIAEALL